MMVVVVVLLCDVVLFTCAEQINQREVIDWWAANQPAKLFQKRLTTTFPPSLLSLSLFRCFSFFPTFLVLAFHRLSFAFCHFPPISYSYLSLPSSLFHSLFFTFFLPLYYSFSHFPLYIIPLLIFLTIILSFPISHSPPFLIHFSFTPSSSHILSSSLFSPFFLCNIFYHFPFPFSSHYLSSSFRFPFYCSFSSSFHSLFPLYSHSLILFLSLSLLPPLFLFLPLSFLSFHSPSFSFTLLNFFSFSSSVSFYLLFLFSFSSSCQSSLFLSLPSPLFCFLSPQLTSLFVCAFFSSHSASLQFFHCFHCSFSFLFHQHLFCSHFLLVSLCSSLFIITILIHILSVHFSFFSSSLPLFLILSSSLTMLHILLLFPYQFSSHHPHFCNYN